MWHRFYFAFVKKQSRFNQSFAVTGRTGIGNFGSFWKFPVNFLNGPNTGSQRISVVIAVKRVKKCSVFTYESSFCSGRTCINTKIAVAAVSGQLGCFYIVLALTFVEFFVIFLGSEKRLHAVYFEFHMYISSKPVAHSDEGYRFCIWWSIQSGTDGCKKMRIIRYNRMFVVQF